MMGAVPGPLDKRPESLDSVGMNASVQGIDVSVAMIYDYVG